MASTGEVWRLGHRPALDGLRGVAVLMVLVNHLRTPHVQSGPVGVIAFFTLSGFLITSVLLDEHQGTGRFELRSFYFRRLFRLGPGVVLLVALSCLLELLSFGHVTDWPLVATTLTWTSNFEMIDLHFPMPTGLGHTWSLGIEEQFYLLWPLAMILMATWSRRRTVVVLLMCAAISLDIRAYVWDGTDQGWARGYFGLDTRADSLLIGCALAFAVRSATVRDKARPWMVAAGCTTLAFWTPWEIQGGDRNPSSIIMPTLVALGTALILFGVASGRGVKFLEWRPIGAVGRISYGLYLYHAPVLLFVMATVGPSVLAAYVIGVPITVMIAVASWLLIEQPIMRAGRHWLAGRSCGVIYVQERSTLQQGQETPDTRRRNSNAASNFVAEPDELAKSPA